MPSWSRIRRHEFVRGTPRWLLGFALVPVLIASTGTGYAFWSAVGSGAADISATTAQPLGVGSMAVPVADLYPGKVSDLGFVLSNANPYPVGLTTLTAVSVTSSDEKGCPSAANIVVEEPMRSAIDTGGYVLPSAMSVPAGATSTSATLPGLIQMSASAPDACQGVSFTVNLAFSGAQV